MFVEAAALEKCLDHREQNMLAPRVKGRPVLARERWEPATVPVDRENLALPRDTERAGARMDRHLDQLFTVLLLCLHHALGGRHARGAAPYCLAVPFEAIGACLPVFAGNVNDPAIGQVFHVLSQAWVEQALQAFR